MMGELARRYPPARLVVSTGTHEGGIESDAAFPHPVDRVGVRATRLRTLGGLLRWTARARALARRYAPGFVWCAELKPAGYPARTLGLPYGVVVHGTELLLLESKIARSPWRRWVAARLLGDAAVIVANSTWTAGRARALVEAIGPAARRPPIRTVPLGTDPAHFRPGVDARPVRAHYDLGPGPWLLTVARLEWHKGIDTAIRALPAVRAAIPGVCYAVAGVGPRRPQLERLAAELGLGSAVRFLGGVPDADLPALYNATDLYVGVSRRHGLLVEGFGISIVEASACGLAVVGGRAGGVPDAVRDGETGVLVDPDDPGAVANGVVGLLTDVDRRRRMGTAGRRAVESYFNWDRVGRELIAIDEEFRVGAGRG
jgi:phosphatidylinositol alpha-1,6-mannosyltransferase